MNEKLFKHTDQRIRDAAGNVQPPFDEESWKRMEALLEDKKRRPFLFWFFLSSVLLIIMGLVIYIYNINHTAHRLSSAQPVSSTQLQHAENASQQTTGNRDIKTSSIQNNNNSELQSSSVSDNNLNDLSEKLSAVSPSVSVIATSLQNVKSVKRNKKKITKSRLAVSVSQSNISEETQTDADQSLSFSSETLHSESNPEKYLYNEKDSSTVKNIVDDHQQDTATMDAVKKEKPLKKKNKTSQKWYALAGGGIESSNVKFLSFKNAVVVPRYGIGIGFQINNKWSIQTGLYVSAKKYVAGPKDYKPAPGSYLSSVDFIKADANCLVYDIPLTVRYNIHSSKTMKTFITTGLHSYIMKSEEYDYAYNVNNYTYHNSYSYTGNKGFFGVISISGGVEKKMNNHLSLIGEPYITIPLKGVGEGQVKLFSVGLQAFIKYSF